MIKLPILISLFFVSVVGFSQGTKKIRMYNNTISFQLPLSWIHKPHYKTFSNYQIIHDEKYFSKSGNAALLLDVYDESFGSDSITIALLEYQKKQILKTKSPSTKFLSTGINKVGKIDVGYFTYTYLNLHEKLAYGTQLFFKLANGKGVHVEIFNECKNLNESKRITDDIVLSLGFK